MLSSTCRWERDIASSTAASLALSASAACFLASSFASNRLFRDIATHKANTYSSEANHCIEHGQDRATWKKGSPGESVRHPHGDRRLPYHARWVCWSITDIIVPVSLYTTRAKKTFVLTSVHALFLLLT